MTGPDLSAESVRTWRREAQRFRDALVRIEQNTRHNLCNGCGACIAHFTLYGHWPNDPPMCCFDTARTDGSVPPQPHP